MLHENEHKWPLTFKNKFYYQVRYGTLEMINNLKYWENTGWLCPLLKGQYAILHLVVKLECWSWCEQWGRALTAFWLLDGAVLEQWGRALTTSWLLNRVVLILAQCKVILTIVIRVGFLLLVVIVVIDTCQCQLTQLWVTVHSVGTCCKVL